VSELFRREAVRHATRRLAGEVIIASSTPTTILVALFALIVFAGAAFAATATYARKETVVGWLAPPAGLIRLTARQGGVVAEVLVAEGDFVVEGQTVATIKLSSELTDGDSFAALSASLDTQVHAAEGRMLARQAALAAEAEQLRARASALAREAAETRRRVSMQAERVRLARAEVERAEAIAAQGFLPRRELEARQAQALGMELQASDLAAAVLSYEREIGEANARLQAIPIDLQAASAEAESVRASLDQQRTQTQAQASYRVVATVAGRVAALPVAVGQSVPPGAALAVVMPGGGHIGAELYAPSRASGFIRPGQEVRLMYQAFPHQKFGTGRGEVTSVSRTVLAPSELAIPGLEVREPVFRVNVRLPEQTVEAYGQNLPLQPGMLVSADIVIDRRSLFEWLLDPLYAAGRRG